MKKLLSILCVSIIALTAASCKKETVVAPSNNITVIRPVKSTDWKLTDNNTSYYVDISVPQLDNLYDEQGAVLVYIAYGDGPWEQVPQVYQGKAFSFTHNVGFVSLYVQNSGGIGTPNRPDNMSVKIVLVDSSF